MPNDDPNYGLEKETSHSKKEEPWRRGDQCRFRDSWCIRGIISFARTIAIRARSVALNDTVFGSQSSREDTNVIVVQLLLTNVDLGVADIVAHGEVRANLARRPGASIVGCHIVVKVVVGEACGAGGIVDRGVVFGIIQVFIN